MKKIAASPRQHTLSETALKYREAIGADRTLLATPHELDGPRPLADTTAKPDLRERFCHFGKIRSNDRLKQQARLAAQDRPTRTGYLDAFEVPPPSYMAQTSPAQLQTSLAAHREDPALQTSQHFRQKFKQEYRRADELPPRCDHRHKNSPQLARQLAARPEDLRAQGRPDLKLQSELKEVNEKIAVLADQLSKIMPIIGSLAEKGLQANRTAALSADDQDSEVFDYRKKDKECLSVQHEPYSNGFWDQHRNPKPAHLKSGISTEGKQASSKQPKKNIFATQNHFEDDRQSKTESSPLSKSSIEHLELEGLSHQQLLDLREKVDTRLRQSQYDRSDIGSHDDISDFRKRKPHNVASVVSSTIKPPVVPTAAASNAFHDRKVLLNPRDSSSIGKRPRQGKQSEYDAPGNPG